MTKACCCGADGGWRCGDRQPGGTNEGELDRAGRGVAALIALGIGLANRRSTAGKVLTGIGVALAVSAITGCCCVYRALGVDTTDACTVANLKARFGK
jgi:uncharacterized membrane protein